jgi:hypothetical protein
MATRKQIEAAAEELQKHAAAFSAQQVWYIAKAALIAAEKAEGWRTVSLGAWNGKLYLTRAKADFYDVKAIAARVQVRARGKKG